MSISNVSSKMRISGLASGLDTDSIIKQLMDAERIPLTKLQQNKQLLEWKRDSFREISNILRGFQNQFFDVLKPSSNMQSASAYKKFTTNSTNSSIATATANANALSGTHTISGTKLATAANVSSGAVVSSPLVGTGVTATDFTGGNTKFNINLNGVTKTINLAAQNYGDVNTLINDGTNGIQKLVNDAFGAGKITVSDSGGGILRFDAANSTLTLTNATTNNALASMNIASNSSNRIDTSQTLETLASKFSTGLTFNGTKLDFSINGTNFSIDKSSTLNDLISQINSSSAGVELKYSEATDKFTITTKQKGAGNNLTIVNSGGNFFGGSSGINAGSYNNGQDAEFTLDGQVLTRNNNTFTIDGVSYTLKDDTGISTTITVNQDVDGIYNNIKSFVDKYNEVVDKLTTELSEKYDRNYLPLTDDQKKNMSEDDIKKWEEKAKTGLLRNDGDIEKIVINMRKALTDGINGVSGSLSQIGIKTGSWWDNGKLYIDESKLKEAIQNNPDKVQNIFAKSSTISYSPNLTVAERNQRYGEEGIANRFFDIMQDSIRTTRSNSGTKGSLIEKAGIVGDITEFNNMINSEIKAKNKDIDNLITKLSRKEENYYKRFSALEQAISKMNSQGSWLSQQLGGGN